MKYYIFRNTTVESFFSKKNMYLSGYDDISQIPDWADGFIWFYLLPFRQNEETLAKEINAIFNRILYVVNRTPENKDLLIFTLVDYSRTPIVIGDFSVNKAISKFNSDCQILSKNKTNVKIIDFSDFTNQYNSNELIDWKYYYIAQMQLNPRLAGDFKTWFDNKIQTFYVKRKKCVIIDLDNTLWGGVLGEDGSDGIQLGGDYPGNAFLEFQKFLLELKKSGILLAVCSKNNENDVFEVWNNNTNIVIKEEHLAAWRINWKNKAENIRELIKELNIGAESIIFIDDNPRERKLVKDFFPEIETPDFPNEPYRLSYFIKEITEKYFQTYDLTKEDKNKTIQYKANIDRRAFESKFSTFEDFLKNLKMELYIEKANLYTIPRISQLTQKTNQFNFTTRRYTSTDIKSICENGNLITCLNVKDCFGDSGLTGVLIIYLNHEKKEGYIDSFLMSCRILGKGIEEAFLFSVLSQLKKEGFNLIKAIYSPTSKNQQVKKIYEKLGFQIIKYAEENKKIKHYILDLTQMNLEIKSYYKIEENYND